MADQPMKLEVQSEGTWSALVEKERRRAERAEAALRRVAQGGLSSRNAQMTARAALAGTPAPAETLEEGLRHWLSDRDKNRWLPGLTPDFKDGYTTAVEEIRALAIPTDSEAVG